MSETKPLFYKSMTGFGADSRMISYVTFWSADWATNAQMFFYPKEPDRIVDVFRDTDATVTIVTYPHNDTPKCKEIALKFSKEIHDMAESMKDTSNTFSIILEDDGPVFLMAKDFTEYYPPIGVKNYFFLFDDDSFGFPLVYCIAEVQRNAPFHKMAKILANSSHISAKPVNAQTLVGKRLFYILSNSISQGKFDSTLPTLDAIKFPTNSFTDAPARLQVGNFLKLLEKAGADKLSNKPTSFLDAKEEPNTGSVISPNSNYQLDDKIVTQILEKACVNLSDLFTYGIMDSLKMIGNSDTIITVIPDLPSLARKMCIYQAKLYCVPILSEKELRDFLDIPDDIFVISSEDTFPKYSTI